MTPAERNDPRQRLHIVANAYDGASGDPASSVNFEAGP